MSNKKYNVLKWLGYHKETIHILASISTIFALILAIFIFKSELDNQKQIELNEHIANVKSLELELATNINLTYKLINLLKTNIEKQPAFYSALITENLERSTIDGKISNERVKNQVIGSLFYTVELNNVIKSASSPEFADSPIRIKLFAQIRNKSETIYIPYFNTTYLFICVYRSCLEEKLDIKYCNKNLYPVCIEPKTDLVPNKMTQTC